MDELFGPVQIGTLLGVIYSICVHEAAHAYAADRLGDRTARLLGRCTLNPIPHIQATPLTTLLLPLVTFIFSKGTMVFGGGACPVNVSNLRDPKRGDVLVSLAGPGANLLLSILFAIVFVIPGVGDRETVLSALVLRLGLLNFILFAFNLLPFPPLDGSRVLRVLVPDVGRLYDSVVAYGPFIPLLVAVLVFNAIGKSLVTTYWGALEVLYRLVN